MSGACERCGTTPPRGQRLWPATRWNESLHRYRPERLCLGCLTEKDPKPKGFEARKTGSVRRGTMVPTAKVTEEQVRELRALKGSMPQRALAQMYGINQSTLNAILNRRRWRHVL